MLGPDRDHGVTMVRGRAWGRRTGDSWHRGRHGVPAPYIPWAPWVSTFKLYTLSLFQKSYGRTVWVGHHPPGGCERPHFAREWGVARSLQSTVWSLIAQGAPWLSRYSMFTAVHTPVGVCAPMATAASCRVVAGALSTPCPGPPLRWRRACPTSWLRACHREDRRGSRGRGPGGQLGRR